MRHPHRLLLLTSSLLLVGCGLLPGGSEAGGDRTSSAPPDPTLTSVGWKPVAGDKIANGGTMRLATEALPKNFNPQHTSNATSEVGRILQPTVGSAVRLTADGGWKVDPNYARSVEVVDTSPLTIRVELNPRAVWQDGDPITADDMVAFWKAQNGSEEKFDVLSTQGYDEIDRVKRGDDEFSYTVTFDDPTADWPRYVYPALPANISSKAARFNKGFTDRAIPSNGPYQVASIDRATGQVVQQRNPRWWGAKPRLRRITWQAATPQLQLKALRAGDLDAVDVPSALVTNARDAARADDDLVLERSAGAEWTQLTMNGAAGPLKDVRVRRAIALALDRKAIAATMTTPIGSPPVVQGSFVLLPGQRGYVDQSDLIAPDPAEAARLLDKAGWQADGESVRTRKGTSLTLDMPVPAQSGSNRARAKLIATQLAAVGIEVDVQPVPDEDFFDTKIIPLDFDLATFTHQGGAFPVVDAKSQFYPIDSGQNFTGMEDDDLARDWDKAIAALEDTERFRIIKVLDRRLFRDVPLVPLGVVPQVTVVRGAVANYGPAQFIDPDWTRVGLLSPSNR